METKLVYPERNGIPQTHLHPTPITIPNKTLTMLRKFWNRNKEHCPECGSSNIVGCGRFWTGNSAYWYDHCNYCGHDFYCGGMYS